MNPTGVQITQIVDQLQTLNSDGDNINLLPVDLVESVVSTFLIKEVGGDSPALAWPARCMARACDRQTTLAVHGQGTALITSCRLLDTSTFVLLNWRLLFAGLVRGMWGH